MTADLATLFGSQSFCECAHCRSVYSPAAYLVDLLHELDDLTHKDLASVSAPIAVLLQRRPDIARIPLTCENTNTTLPYIDLVNEALESYIESQLAPPSAPTITAHDTGMVTADELRAVPQHVVAKVYEHLGLKAVYPMTLPFHRPLEVARAYLAHLGTSRAEIMEVFGAENAASKTRLVVERLGMCPAQYQIIAASPSTSLPFDSTEVDGLKDLWGYYGYASGSSLSLLKAVPELLHRTGIAFDDLVALLKTRVLNPKLYSDPKTDVVEIEFPSSLAEDACDVSQMKLTHLESPTFAQPWLDRLHRFIRLWRGMGWSVADTDGALAVAGGALDGASLEKLAALKELADMAGAPVASWFVLWGDLDTWGVRLEKGPPPNVTYREEPAYAEVFLNRAALQDPESRKVFEDVLLREGGLLPGPSEMLDKHLSSVAAALAVPEDDVERIRSHAGLENASLDRPNLSKLCRHAILAKALGIRVRDLITLLKLAPASMDPFVPKDPRPALEFIRTVQSVQASGFPIPLLNYLFRDESEPTRHPAPTRALVEATLKTLQDGLAAIHQEMLVSEQPPAEILRARLEVAAGSELLNLQVPEDVERALAVLDPRVTELEGTALTLQDREKFVEDHFKSFLADPAKTLFGTPLPTSTDPATDLVNKEERFLKNVDTVLKALLPWLRRKLQETLVGDTIASAMGLEPGITRRLLETLRATPSQPPALEYLLGLVAEDGTPIDLHLDEDPPKPPTLAVHTVHRVFKAAAYVNGFGMTDAELDLFTGPLTPLPNFTPAVAPYLYLNELPIEGVVPAPTTPPGTLFDLWRALRTFYELREASPRSEKTLVDYFQTKDPDTLVEAAGWTKDQMSEVMTHLGVPSHPLSLPQLILLHRAMGLLKRVGATLDRMSAWAGKTPGHAQAGGIVQTVKARYERSQWLEVARGLNDRLRELQREALVAYLIPRIPGAKTANDLFEHFLLDVEMGSCMLTSRIKQAVSSVQLFVQRCQLNLEPAVSPAEIEPERWEWMKQYRISEANKKVFLYPEMYVLPELRDDKTPFFKELETELLQDELTEESVEKALLNYLYKLNEVGHLQVAGLCRDQSVIHLFARTFNPPHACYHREFDLDTSRWTAWGKVDLDIEGDHIIPVVWHRRLYLFWPVFAERAAEDQELNDQPLPEGSPTVVDLEIRMNWSEFYQDRWQAKRTSSKTVRSSHFWWTHIRPNKDEWYYLHLPEPEYHYFQGIVTADDHLVLECVRKYDAHRTLHMIADGEYYGKGEWPVPASGHEKLGTFRFVQCNGALVADDFTKNLSMEQRRGPAGSHNEHMGFAASYAGFTFQDAQKTKVLHQTKEPFQLITTPQTLEPANLYYPFLFQDEKRSYLVHPVEKKVELLDVVMAAAMPTRIEVLKDSRLLEFVPPKDPDPTLRLADVEVSGEMIRRVDVGGVEEGMRRVFR